MSNQDKMLQLVLSDNVLCSNYEYNPSDYPTIKDALESDSPVVVATALIIHGINGRVEKNIYKEVYSEVFNYLNKHML